MRIVGIDPGLRRTGFGIIQAEQGRLSYIASGTIAVPTDLALYQRLHMIGDHILHILQEYQPEQAAIEKVFVNSNPQSTLLLGQARGVAIYSLAQHGLDVTEYTALQIKKAIVGRGHADKSQVQAMVQYILNLNNLPNPDPADALACAICHAHAAPLTQRLLTHHDSPIKGQTRLRHGRLVD